MAKSSRFARLDEDVLLEFIYHDQDVSIIDDAKIENDENGSQIKVLDSTASSADSRYLIHELGADVVNFTVTIANGYVYINNFASRRLVLKNGKTYKFNLTDVSIDNAAGFLIPGGTLNNAGTIYTYSPTTNGTYNYEYTNLAGTSFIGGEINVSNRANSLFATPDVVSGNDIKTAATEVGRWYAVPSGVDKEYALLDNDLTFLDSTAWNGTTSTQLQVVNNTTVSAVWYDTVRLHLKTGYSFSGRGYEGFVFQVKSKRKTGVENYFTSIAYLNSSNFEIQNPKPFTLGDTSYSKYIEVKIPALVHMETTSLNKDFNDTFFGVGQHAFNPTANYDICFQLIDKIVDLNNVRYATYSEETKMTLSQEDEFTDISANIVESSDGDYFEVYGTYNGSTSAFENYITGRLETSGDDISVFHDIEVSEQLANNYIKTYATTFVQTEQYDEPVLYRPVILNSNISSSFLITHTMRIYNETDNTQIVKQASIINTTPKKYGKSFSKINLNSNIGDNVIYNTLPNTSVNRELNQFVNSIRPSIGETKYVPVALDTYRIMASSSKVSVDGTEINVIDGVKYFEEGETEMTLSKVSDNFVKFNVAQPSGESIQNISFVNAEDIVLIIKSGTVEQRISHDPSFPDIDAAEGEILFKVTKDVATRFDQKDTNISEDKFYINIKNGETESLLYYGKVKIV